jgi:predicted transcriptional regulator
MVEYSDDHEDDDDAEFIYSSVSDDVSVIPFWSFPHLR